MIKKVLIGSAVVRNCFMDKGFIPSLAAISLLLFAALASAQEGRVGKTSQPLTIKNVQNWTANGNVVPVCWVTAWYNREKAIIREAVTASWELYANIRFTGWDDACPTSGSAKHVRIGISPQGTENSGAWGEARLGMEALSSASDPVEPGVRFTINPDGTADRGRVEYIGVHEFGHVLGFVHEQDTPGNVEGPAHCDRTTGKEVNASSLTAYDRDSIMNYCNRDGNMKGNLTDTDIIGVQAVYGVRVPNIASKNSCVSSMPKLTASLPAAWNDGGQRSSLAAAWNDGGQTSLALYPSARTRFLNHTAMSVRQGGWADDVKWFAGDFNGDGLTEIGAAWNNGGANTLTVRQKTASGISATHWAINAGGWSPTAVWLPGDFNGDGLTDVAAVWNDGGQVSIAVFLSDGKKFLSPVQWSIRDGGWGDTGKWFVGDFDGDGRADIGAAWNNNGATVLTVRLSTGSRFVHTHFSFREGKMVDSPHWSLNAGNWSDSSVFVSGDFNGDGYTDVARIWNDLGRVSIAVSSSHGGWGFDSPSDWSIRDGGWMQGKEVKWFVGDFNGDGRADIGGAWNYGGTNTLTVRQSTGKGFSVAHWAVNAGGWMDTTAWCTGQFTSLRDSATAKKNPRPGLDIPPDSPTATKKAPLGAALTAKTDPKIGAAVDSSPSGFISKLAKTPPHYQPLWIYGIRPNGELIWYCKDSNASVWQGPKTVGTGWNSFKDVIPAGGNCFFALAQDGKLLWYRHDGFNDGSFTWPKPVEVGNGWAFSRIFSGGQGIVYAIKSDGTLLWYRNNDNLNGSREWQGPKVVGSGWNQFKDVFSTGQGTIYAVRSDGRLSLYRHDGYATGEAKWQQDRVVGTGWNSFKQIVPSSDGVILAILPDGKLLWYKHLGLTAPIRIGKLKETWEGPVEIGSGWQGFQKVIASIPDPPAAVR